MSKTTNKFAPEVRERAVRMVLDLEIHRITSIWQDRGFNDIGHRLHKIY